MRLAVILPGLAKKSQLNRHRDNLASAELNPPLRVVVPAAVAQDEKNPAVYIFQINAHCTSARIGSLEFLYGLNYVRSRRFNKGAMFVPSHFH